MKQDRADDSEPLARESRSASDSLHAKSPPASRRRAFDLGAEQSTIDFARNEELLYVGMSRAKSLLAEVVGTTATCAAFQRAM